MSEDRAASPQEMSLAEKKSIAVCVATYRRSEGLRHLLLRLNQQRFVKCDEPRVEIVVVDNDPAASGRETCEELRARIRWPVRYRVERRPGISHARNSALSCADGGGFDFVAFLDDDEVPCPSWLDELLHVQEAYAADIVSGPQISVFDEPVPAWIKKGRFFEHPRHSTGRTLEMASTSNVLMAPEVFEGMDGPFDERFALTGGEDTHFFMRVCDRGRKVTWADEALVYESVPEDRMNASWILRRAYRHGNTLSLCERDLRPSLATRLKRMLKGLTRVVQGTVLVAPSSLLGKHVCVQALAWVCYGAGSLSGLAGKAYEEYRREPLVASEPSKGDEETQLEGAR